MGLLDSYDVDIDVLTLLEFGPIAKGSIWREDVLDGCMDIRGLYHEVP